MLEAEHQLLLRVQRSPNVTFPAHIGLGRVVEGRHDVGGLLIDALAQARDRCLRGLVIRVILTQVGGDVLELGFLLREAGFQAGYEPALQHLRERVVVAAHLALPRLAILPDALDRHQLRRQLGQTGVLDVQPLVGGDESVLLLVIRQFLMLGFEVGAQGSRPLVEPRGIFTRRIDFELDVRVDIGLREGIRKRRRPFGIGQRHRYVDDITFARR